jgi:multiple sugar transport system ATP-binding protein
MSTIEFKNICKRYDGSQNLTINNANIKIEQGEFCVFVGPSGCGKSTLLRMTAGHEDITSGDLLIDGKRANDIAPAKRGLAMVFQSYALYPHMTVRQNMAFGLQVLGADKAAIERKVQADAEALQLGPLMDRLPKALSGGQRQRVAIARALVNDPSIILADEPTGNLDSVTSYEIMVLFEQIHKAGNTIILVTHEPDIAEYAARRIVFRDGQVIDDAAVKSRRRASAA